MSVFPGLENVRFYGLPCGALLSSALSEILISSAGQPYVTHSMHFIKVTKIPSLSGFLITAIHDRIAVILLLLSSKSCIRKQLINLKIDQQLNPQGKSCKEMHLHSKSKSPYHHFPHHLG